MARRHDRRTRQGWIGTGVTLCVMAAIVGLATKTEFFTTLNFSRQSNSQTAEQDDDVLYTGSIIFNPETVRCEQMKFDNRNGRFGEKAACNDRVLFDSQGNPLPPESSPRLDAIRRSFPGSRP